MRERIAAILALVPEQEAPHLLARLQELVLLVQRRTDTTGATITVERTLQLFTEMTGQLQPALRE